MGSQTPAGPPGTFPPGMQATQQIRVNLTECPDLTCTECGSIFFRPLLRYKIVSGIQSGTGKEQLLPAQVLECADCGHRRWGEGLDKEDKEKSPAGSDGK